MCVGCRDTCSRQGVGRMEKWMTENIVQDVQKAYDVKIWATLPMRSVVGLASDRGRLIVKRYGQKQELSRERMEAIVDVKEQLANRGLCSPYLRTIEGQGYYRLGSDLLTVEPWIAGKHADFSDRFDRLRAVQAVARLHHVKLAVPYRLHVTQSIAQKFSYRLRKAVDVVNAGGLQGISQKEWDTCRRQAEHILRILPEEELQSLTQKSRDAGVLCHRDLAPHNILVQSGMPAKLIDFDLAGSDTPLYDLHQIFDHMAYRTGTLDWFDETLYAYVAIHPLSLREQALLRLLLRFPTPLLREIGELQAAHSARSKKRATMRVRYVNRLMQERLHANT